MSSSLLLTGLLAATMPASQPVAAQVPDPPAFARMCNANGALEHRFGDTGVAHSSRLERSMGLGWELAPEQRPFTRGQGLATPWSDRLAQVEYSVAIADPEGGAAALEALSFAAEQAGWVRNRELEDAGEVPMYLMPVAGDRVYELPGSSEALASFSYGLGQLTMVCAHKGLLRSNAEEALGRLPEGTPRPAVPTLPIPRAHAPAECSRPEVQDEMLVIIDGEANRLIAQLLARASFAERLLTWKQWKLQSSGRVTPERLMELTLAALETGSPGSDPLAGFALMSDILDVIGRVAKEAEAGDRPAACRSALALFDLYRRMEAISSRQSQALDTSIEAEARRVRVSLD